MTEGEKKRGFCRLVAITAILAGSAIAFFVIGALGPSATKASHHALYMCIIPDGRKVIRDEMTFDPIDHDRCQRIGQKLEFQSARSMRAYPSKNVVFYTMIPYKKGQVMSRLFQYLLADLGIHFSSSEYPEKLMKYGLNMLRFEIALGYRDDTSGPWKRLAGGNVTRMLQCQPNHWGYHTCDHLPFFELGSCHHKQYIVNVWLPSLPLGSSAEEYTGLAPLSQLTAYVIYQTTGFTRLWLKMKSVLCFLSFLLLAWFLRRMTSLTTAATLIEKSLGLLGACLVFYNAPLELISLYFDCPWLLVVNDFRQGLFIAALFSFWVVFIGEHGVERDIQSHISHYWKQIGVVFTSCIFLFVYEFCERGIQVIFPFYSLWSNWLSRSIAWVFIGIAGVSTVLYVLVLLVMVVRVYQNMREKERGLSHLSASARQRFEVLFSQWKYFLLVTLVVAVMSVGTVVLPSEILLHQWQQDKGGYSFYSALLMGNYGSWNAYSMIMMITYAPGSLHATLDTETATAQKLLAKQSHE